MEKIKVEEFRGVIWNASTIIQSVANRISTSEEGYKEYLENLRRESDFY